MRRAALALPVLLATIAACQEEPSFDERYEAAQVKIRETAQGIDSDLAKAAAARGPDDRETPAAGDSPAAPSN